MGQVHSRSTYAKKYTVGAVARRERGSSCIFVAVDLGWLYFSGTIAGHKIYPLVPLTLAIAAGLALLHAFLLLLCSKQTLDPPQSPPDPLARFNALARVVGLVVTAPV